MNNPFIEIMKPYFSMLESMVGHLADEATKHNVDPPDLVRDFLRDKKMEELVNSVLLPRLSGYCVKFWKDNFTLVEREIADLPGLRSMFGGDIGPQAKNKLYQRTGSYFDTVIVSDPVLRSIVNPQFQRHRNYYVLKFAVNLVLSKGMYLCESYPPIAVLRGEPHMFGPDEDYYRELSFVSEIDTVLATNRIFGKSFETFVEAQAFFAKANSDDEALSEIVEPESFILIGEIPHDPSAQLMDMDRELKLHIDEDLLPTHMKGPVRILSSIHHRMMQVNDLLRNSSRSKANPIIQAPVSFHWLTIKLETNAPLLEDVLDSRLRTELPVTNALLSSRLDWLSNIELNDLERMRGVGFLPELREIISQNIKLVTLSNLDDLERFARQADLNINSALNKHQQEIQKSVNTNLDEIVALTPAMLATVGGSFLPLIGILPDWLPATIFAAGGLVTLKDLVPKIQRLRREREEFSKSPMGILWNARENSL